MAGELMHAPKGAGAKAEFAGYGFCFLGRQYRLALGRKEYFVDLHFYLKRVDAPVGVKPALRCSMELSE